MPIYLRHPGLDALSDHAAGEDAPSRPALEAHLARCERCRESVRLLRRLGAQAERDDAVPSEALCDRILASRAAGVRTFLPAGGLPRRVTRWRLVAASAASVLLALGGTLLFRPAREVQAGGTTGTLTLTPAMPRAGQVVRVRYVPASPLAGAPSLALRARLRTVHGDSYDAGIRMARVAVLVPDGAGAFGGTFMLPDSVVYAALAVEDRAANVVDDRGGRAWELLVSDAAGRPRFDALLQRSYDMMGRNEDEGFATVRRMVALYPDEVLGWKLLHFHQSWLGLAGEDSVRRLHRARLRELDERFWRDTTLAPETVGEIAWYALDVDSTIARRWRARLLREAPSNDFALQWRLIDIARAPYEQHDSATAMRRLEALWADAIGDPSSPPRRREQIARYALYMAGATSDAELAIRWADRYVLSARDPRREARWVARSFAGRPSVRADGMRRIRVELAALDSLPDSERALGETAARQRERHEGIRRTLLAALGQALVAAGEPRAGLDTLALATAAGWDVDVFRAAFAGYLATGDTARALEMAARRAVDPRTDSTFLDSARSLAVRVESAWAWDRRLAAARGAFVRRMLEGATTRSLRARIRMRDTAGRVADLRKIARGRATLVAFWSRTCAPAVAQLPRLDTVAARLQRSGVRVVGIVQEASPSPELARFLAEQHVSVPTYLDSWHEASGAFNQWGTPYYYVLDAAGRLRFAATTSLDLALARAEALRLAGEPQRSASGDQRRTDR